MTANAAVLAGRSAALALMQDSCVINVESAGLVYDPTSDTDVPAAGAQLYAGPCRVKPAPTDRVVEAGAQTVSLFPFTVSVPVDATAYSIGDLVTVTACVLDPALVGKVLRVRQVLAGSHLTARRLGCEMRAT